MKIDIQTPDKKHATDIAMLVDKPEFLLEIEKLRQKWSIKELYRPSAFHSFLEFHIMTNKDTVSIDKEVKKRLSEFNNDIDLVLKKFNRGRNFKRVVEYALATGIVPNGIYRSCYFDLVKIGESNDLEQPERYEYVIVLSPRTELKEVRNAYKEFKEHIKGKIDFESIANLDIEIPTDKELIEQYHRGNIYKSADIDKFKTLKELSRTREWYWIKYETYFSHETKKPMSYPEVLKKWQENCPINKQNQKKKRLEDKTECSCPYCLFYDINIIEQAINSYNKLLVES
ncbi:MAG TPA: hypothetical protein VMR77_03710 [Patescibacteria group bacterium]|jgi:hypothetical protein|nr:hypothetical protein [Patescibacteria group bacterium]